MRSVLEYPQTRFFQNCRGVFEGGGCRGAAHIGAYEASIRCGVNFSEVAGTSAGSIVAALIGAGATPEFLMRHCAHLKFSEFLTNPRGSIATPRLARIAGPLLRGSRRPLGRILSSGAAHSSQRLESWLDDLLAELVPNVQRPIKFKDLILPTWVVATDLSGRRPKVWSTKETPDEVVAMAVRSSCSIPLFFEPVEVGNSLYVDGGMLSNLPAFVFAQDAKSATSVGGRILAFCLVETRGADIERNLWSLVSRLIDTAIGGATAIQRNLQSNVSVVPIGTGGVSSINFNISTAEVDGLLAAGRQAMVDFVRDEHTRINDGIASDTARYSDDELYDDIVREMAVPGQRLIVACEKTRWFWDLFPSIAHWLFAGARIDVIVQRGAITPREGLRRELLRKLGARVQEVDALPQQCFLLSRNDASQDALFITNISENQFTPKGAAYVGAKHRPVISMFLAELDRSVPGGGSQSPVLTLRRESPDAMMTTLKRGVTQYGSPEVRIALEEVDLQLSRRPVRMIVQRIRSFKYRQMEYLENLYQRNGIPFCMPAGIYVDDEYVSSIAPPVLEKWGDCLVAIEGNTRILRLMRRGATSVMALVVSGVDAPLPGRSVDPREVLLSTAELPMAERIRGLQQNHFRPIEGVLRPIS